MSAPYEGATYAVVGALVDELVRAGVRRAVVSPGSRSAPVALHLARRPEIALYVHPDERSAAYLALGMAKADGRPVVLVCTSGTAAANYLPAVAEARHARVPLVVLTADRPPEQRDVAAAQTIDQVRMFGTSAKWAVDLPPPAALGAVVRHARVVGARAAHLALLAPMGPVHVNIPLREPLLPLTGEAEPPGLDGLPWQGEPEGAAYVRFEAPASVDDDAARALARSLAAAGDGVVVAGPEPGDGLEAARARARTALRLATRLGWPLLADPLAGARTLPEAVRRHDAYLRTPKVMAALAPEAVLRLGAPPVSKVLGEALARVPSERSWLVEAPGAYADPSLVSGRVVEAPAAPLLRRVAAHLRADTRPTALAGRFARAEAAAARAEAEAMAAMPDLFEGRVLYELADLMPAGSTLFVGNSMPVRDADTFFQARRRDVAILGNRGASGIDGVVSSAFGARAARPDRPLVLVLGDLSFFHDLNGLLAARRFGLSLTVVVLQNDGGGIFSFLPQARHGEAFERLFGTPLGLNVEPAVTMHGGRFWRVARVGALRRAVRQGLRGEGLTVVEAVCPTRAENVRLHEGVYAAMGEAARVALAAVGR